MARIPLEAHLRNGIATVTDPSTVTILAVYVLITITAMYGTRGAGSTPASDPDEPEPEAPEPDQPEPDEPEPEEPKPEEPEPPASGSERWWRRQVGKAKLKVGCWLTRLTEWWRTQVAKAKRGVRWLRSRPEGPFHYLGARGYLGLLVLILAWVMVSLPWGGAVLALVSAAGVAMPYLLVGDQPTRLVRTYLYSLLITVAVVSGLNAYYRSNPLPTGRIVTGSGVITAPIIASDGGVLYIGPNGTERLYSAIPVSRVLSFSAKPQQRAEESSILNWLGIDSTP